MYLVQETQVISDDVFIEPRQKSVVRLLYVEVGKNLLEYCKVSLEMVQSLLCDNKANRSF